MILKGKFLRRILILGTCSALIYGLWIELDGYSSASSSFGSENALLLHAKKESKEIQSALSQPYTFLGSGNQCFAYVSQDNQYVLKLFKERFHFPHTWIARLPNATNLFPYLQKKQSLAAQKYAKVLSGHVLAAKLLWEETALLYLHLAPTTHLFAKLKVQDRLGMPHELLLDDRPFLLQRKAMLAKEYLSMRSHQKKETREAIQSLFSLVKLQTDQKVHDEDFNPRTNLGFVDDRAVFIDAGRFTLSPPEVDQEQERANLDAKIRAWVSEQCGISLSS